MIQREVEETAYIRKSFFLLATSILLTFVKDQAGIFLCCFLFMIIQIILLETIGGNFGIKQNPVHIDGELKATTICIKRSLLVGELHYFHHVQLPNVLTC